MGWDRCVPGIDLFRFDCSSVTQEWNKVVVCQKE